MSFIWLVISQVVTLFSLTNLLSHVTAVTQICTRTCTPRKFPWTPTMAEIVFCFHLHWIQAWNRICGRGTNRPWKNRDHGTIQVASFKRPKKLLDFQRVVSKIWDFPVDGGNPKPVYIYICIIYIMYIWYIWYECKKACKWWTYHQGGLAASLGQ